MSGLGQFVRPVLGWQFAASAPRAALFQFHGQAILACHQPVPHAAAFAPRAFRIDAVVDPAHAAVAHHHMHATRRMPAPWRCLKIWARLPARHPFLLQLEWAKLLHYMA